MNTQTSSKAISVEDRAELINSIVNDVRTNVIAKWSVIDQNEFYLGPWVAGQSLSQYYHTLGRWIRNKYNLWTIPWEPQLEERSGCMCDCSPYHPDAISTTIIKEVWKKGP